MIVGIDIDIQYVVGAMGPRFGINNATVVIQFNESSQEYGSLVSYNVTSSSQVEMQTHEQERTTFQQVIPYNIQINVSITARLCMWTA